MSKRFNRFKLKKPTETFIEVQVGSQVYGGVRGHFFGKCPGCGETHNFSMRLDCEQCSNEMSTDKFLRFADPIYIAIFQCKCGSKDTHVLTRDEVPKEFKFTPY